VIVDIAEVTTGLDPAGAALIAWSITRDQKRDRL
jgi:hypothetical protein